MYVSARRIQVLQVYHSYVSLTLQPYRFHITAIRGSENDVGADCSSRV